MNEIDRGRGTGIILAAVVGAAVGASVALLLAPRSGRETREWLATRGKEIKDRTMNAFEQGKEATLRATAGLGRAADEAANLVDRPTYAIKPGNTPIRS
jgi:gas vesicle protein